MKKKKYINIFVFLTVLALLFVIQPSAATESEKRILYSEDFESYENDRQLALKLSSVWSSVDDSTWGNRESGFALVNENGGKTLKMSWVGGRLLATKNLQLPKSYEVSFQAKGGTNDHGGGFFFLHTIESGYVVKEIFDRDTKEIRPAVDTDNPIIGIFEEDRDNSDGFSYGVGYAGIYLNLHGDKLYIVVKTQEELSETHAKGIGNMRYAVELPNGKSFDNEYITIRIVEEAQTISVYAEEKLMGKVVYDGLDGDYYRYAEIQDTTGKKVKSTETAMIAEKNVLSFATREANLYLDNINVSTSDEEALKLINIYDESEPEKWQERMLHSEDSSFAFRITTPTGDSLKSVNFIQMPTNGGDKTSFRFSVFRWNTSDDSYDSTIAGDPVFDTVIFNHKDNMDCIITFPEPLGSGTYLCVIWEGNKAIIDAGETSDGTPGIWSHMPPDGESTLIFENGEEVDYGLWVSCVLIEGGDPNATPPEATPTPPAAQTPSLPSIPIKTSSPTITTSVEKNSNTGMLIGIVVGAAVLVGLSVALILILKRKKK